MFTEAIWICGGSGTLDARRGADGCVSRNKEVKKLYDEGKDVPGMGSYLFFKEFYLDSPAIRATLSIAGLGFYRLSINGAAPDEKAAFAPIVSDYSRRVKYDELDVAPLLRNGKNVIRVEVGPGWFAGNPKYLGWQQTRYGDPRLIAELTAVCENGETIRVATDRSWMTAPGCVTFSCVYDGETQDLSLEPGDPRETVDGGPAWTFASEAEAPGGALTRSEAPPVRFTRSLSPVSVNKLSLVRFVYDFGENAAAVPRLLVSGKKGGVVTLRHAEYLKDDGELDAGSENRALCTDTFYLADDGPAELSPRFTWHGYRYAEATLSSPDIVIKKIESRVVNSDVRITGSFECGDERLNELHRTYVRTLLACLQGVPVDCPQRDERKGWLGDAYAVAEACMYNFDMRSLYSEWLDDMRLCRHPGKKYIPFICPTFGDDDTSIDWNLAYPALLDGSYSRYGDLSLLERHYETLKDHTEYYISVEKDGFIPPCWFGDWCTPDRPDGQEFVAFKAGGEDHRQNPPFAATLFYVQTLALAEKIARLTGHDADADRFAEHRARAKKALADKYFDPATGRFGSGGQFLQTYALAEDIVGEKDRPAAVKALIREIEDKGYHPYLGIMGLRRIWDLLCGLGMPDTAYRMLTVDGYPGQFHMLEGGRTTLTETLDHGGSGDHCMFASPDAFLYKRLGGIIIDRSADVPVTIAPFCPEGLSFVRCSQTLPEGEISVKWRRDCGRVVFDLRVPAGLASRISLDTGIDGYDETLPDGGERRIELRA